MHRFEYVELPTLAEVSAFLALHKDTAKVLAGGTDVIVQMRKETSVPRYVVDIKKTQDIILLETVPLGDGPYGVKGVAEPTMVPTAPAIANAIYDAIGVRIKDLPLTAEKVLTALHNKN